MFVDARAFDHRLTGDTRAVRLQRSAGTLAELRSNLIAAIGISALDANGTSRPDGFHSEITGRQ
jgi:hypothetical protein